MNLITIDEIKIARKFNRKNLGEVHAGSSVVQLHYETCTASILPRGKTKDEIPHFIVRIETKEERYILMEYRSPQSICFKNGFLAVLNTAHKVATHIDEARKLVKPLETIFKVAEIG